jgi:NADP-dependent 3-hydroxy acid dehydrogenase YdfG
MPPSASPRSLAGNVPPVNAQARTALVTGASSGIGAATVRSLAAAGFDVVAAARRLERCEELAKEVGGRAMRLDVTDPDSVAEVAEALPDCSVLINNAGGALGLEPVADADEDHWREMYEANVMGVMRMTKALVPALERSGNGHIVVIGSVAGVEVYPGGGGYTAAKHAAHAVTKTLRLELLGKPIRVTEVAPGMVETEFSLVRFGGDQAKADKVYEGTTPLTGEDVAEAIAYVVTRPPHVDIDYVSIKPTDQATARDVRRRE